MAGVLAVAGGTASGKSTLAEALSLQCPESIALVHLDDYYVPAHDPLRGVWTVSAGGHAILDWNHPGSIDEAAVSAAIDAALARPGVRLVVVEGLFALALASVRERADWRVYVDAPDDIRLARKILRKIEVQRQDPRLSLLNYLQSGRERHAVHVAPSRALADLVVDGTTEGPDMLAAVLGLIGPVPAPAPEAVPDQLPARPRRPRAAASRTRHLPAAAV
ncbi:uridine kinase family protein [Actinacidiphila sp. bgisy167]|uniref:uridine kinase family protein n=1 Tax=Actinacidiphila sp. bgisy167 TaxID=3413797 RepID=UPI003D7192DA